MKTHVPSLKLHRSHGRVGHNLARALRLSSPTLLERLPFPRPPREIARARTEAQQSRPTLADPGPSPALTDQQVDALLIDMLTEEIRHMR